jgi:hypothetical protein
MTVNRSPRFVQIIEAARERTTTGSSDTMVVSGHLAQQRLFMLRQGIEFYPKQDTFGHRKTFLDALVLENEIDARLDGVVDDFLLDGKGMWFFRPTRDSYRILWFPKEDYRAYYDSMGELEELHLVYSFSVRSDLMMSGAGTTTDGGQERWVKLIVKRDVIVEMIMPSRPSLTESGRFDTVAFGKKRTVRNSLGFIPAVEAFNNMKSTGMDATGDFDWLAEQIIAHDDLIYNIKENIRFFGNPTLVSSRPKHDIVETANQAMLTRPTITSQAGFSGEGRPSTRLGAPTGGVGGRGSREAGFKIPRLIANVESTDRVQYITPDAVSGDQNLYARQYREELRASLGGVDELGISSGATAYEIKSLYGRAATTAVRKTRGLITYGLCKLLAMIISNEEKVFRDSFAVAIRLKRPEAPLQEQEPDPKKFRKLAEAFDVAMAKYDAKLEGSIRTAIQNEQMPAGVVGLIPDGDRTVDWRWRGPVFEDSTEDMLNKSIVVRNLQELGVASIEALRHLFPDKTDEERSAMLTGFPFRMAQQTQQAIGSFLGLIAQMQQTPHPQSPDLPLLADPRLDITPYLYRAFDFLKRELTYAGTYRDSTGTGEPAGLTAFQRSRLERGLPADASQPPATFVADAPGSGAPGPGGQPMGSGAPGAPLLAERDAQLPGPGVRLASDLLAPTGSLFSGSPGGVPPGANGVPVGAGTRPGGGDGSSGGLYAVPAGVGTAPGAGGLPAGALGTADPFAFGLPRASQRLVPGKRQRRKS